MSDVIWVAGITTLGTLFGAAVGSLANVLGPERRDRKQRELQLLEENRAARYRTAAAFIEAVSLLPVAQTRTDRANVGVIRLAFVATLRPGEAVADAFTANLQERIYENRTNPLVLDMVQTGGSMLFAWLRGDLPSSKLTNIELLARSSGRALG